MEKIAFFRGTSQFGVELDINQWLRKNQARIEIISHSHFVRKLDWLNNEITVSIIYKEK